MLGNIAISFGVQIEYDEDRFLEVQKVLNPMLMETEIDLTQ